MPRYRHAGQRQRPYVLTLSVRNPRPPSERTRARAERSEVASGVFGGRAPVEDYGGGGWVGC